MTRKPLLPNFKGKVLSIVCSGEDTGQLIHSPEFQKQGGRTFLVGTVPRDSSEGNWMEGLPSAIAWDTVQDYVIFDSMEDYLTRLHSRHWPRRGSNSERATKSPTGTQSSKRTPREASKR